MALKYAWMSTLNISTGDDPEADTSTDQRNIGKAQEQKSPPPAQQAEQTPPIRITPQPAAENGRKPVVEAQMRAIHAASKRKGVDYHVYLGEYGCTSCQELTFQQASALITKLNQMEVASKS
jgi:hypothetical protein